MQDHICPNWTAYFIGMFFNDLNKPLPSAQQVVSRDQSFLSFPDKSGNPVLINNLDTRLPQYFAMQNKTWGTVSTGMTFCPFSQGQVYPPIYRGMTPNLDSNDARYKIKVYNKNKQGG